jgi:hypothetical protein
MGPEGFTYDKKKLNEKKKEKSEYMNDDYIFNTIQMNIS